MRILIAGVLGGIIMFGWSFVSWALLPFHGQSLQNLPGEQRALDAQFAQLEPGVYHYPGFPVGEDGGMPNEEQMNEAFARMQAGPVVSFMVVHPAGRAPFPPQNFIIGIVANIFAALLAALLLATAGQRFRGYAARVAFVVGVGVFAIFSYYAQTAAWWGYPSGFVLLDVIDMIVAPLLAGLVIAALIKPGAPEARRASQPPQSAPPQSEPPVTAI